MNKQVKIEKKDGFTTYKTSDDRCFRIVQLGDNKFIIERLFKVKETKSFLWWSKTIIINEWKEIDKKGRKYYLIFKTSPFMSNVNDFESHNTLEEAEKWIYDYNKYPIYH